jgi:hypothetical protein
VTATPTESPSGEVGGATGTPSATSTPGGEVAGATGTPTTTLPPTDTTTGSVSSGSDNWRLALLALAGILAGLLLLTPSRAPARRR